MTDNVSLVQQVPHAGEYGNRSVWGSEFPFQQSGILQNDVLQVCKLPAGARVDELRVIFDDCGTGVTLDIGYAPVNASDGPAAVDDYWASGVDVSTAAGSVLSDAHPITFDYDVYVTATVLGANFTGSPKITVVAKGVATGTK